LRFTLSTSDKTMKAKTATNNDKSNTRELRKRVALVMLDVDAYARRTTTAALMHSDEKVNAARDAREKCVKTITTLVMQASEQDKFVKSAIRETKKLNAR
jgi:hypothetical protein